MEHKRIAYTGQLTKNCNMEKQIKMSLETAREIYRDRNLTNSIMLQWLLENFTKEELEGKKGFTWEESFNGKGWYIGIDGFIYKDGLLTTIHQNRNHFKTKEQAESALAFAQLTHIVAKSNSERIGSWLYSIVPDQITGKLKVCECINKFAYKGLTFLEEKDAKQSLITNKELWEKYWMIKP